MLGYIMNIETFGFCNGGFTFNLALNKSVYKSGLNSGVYNECYYSVYKHFIYRYFTSFLNLITCVMKISFNDAIVNYTLIF